MYDPFIIDKAINYDRPLELPHDSRYTYMCFVDVAGGGGRDSFAIAIGHLGGERVVVDVVRSRAPKFNPLEVTSQNCDLAKEYGISKVYGDKFSGDYASNNFAKYDIEYEKSEKTKSELYLEAESLFNTERVDIPNKELAIIQFKNLIRTTRSGGKDRVDTDSGQSEDEANVIAGVIYLLTQEKKDTGAFVVADYYVDEAGNFHFSNWNEGGLDEKPSPEAIRRNAEIDARQKRAQEEIKAKGERDLAKAQERAKKTGVVTTASINVNLNRRNEDE